MLGVDLDGVCGDYTAAFRRVVAADFAVEESTLGPQTSWDFTEWGVDPADFDRLHRLAVLEHRMFRDMDPLPGCAEVLWRLSDAGVWIRIITHRLCVNWGHAMAVADTVTWLDRTGVPYRDLCFLGRKPEVEADAYIDDGPHNVTALRADGNTVIVFDQPYNRSLPGPRVSGWADVEPLIADLAASCGKPLQYQLPGFGLSPDRLGYRVGEPRA